MLCVMNARSNDRAEQDEMGKESQSGLSSSNGKRVIFAAWILIFAERGVLKHLPKIEFSLNQVTI